MDAGASQLAITTSFALVGVVIVVAALLSGAVERSHTPQVLVFLGLGVVLGPYGLGMLNPALDSEIVRVVATISLVLVLFTDAITLRIADIRRFGGLIALVLGPGTLLTAGLIAAAAVFLLGLSIPAALILGAALASTDPVLVRDVLRMRTLPDSARNILRLESGLNDVVLVPILLIALAFLGHDAPTTAEGWVRQAINLFLLGPGAGVAVGLLAVATMELVRKRIGMRRVYESIYSLGVALAAYAAAEALHGSGFLAAFAAGLTIAALDVELCDCFVEYGETTGELALLFTFVLFGSSLIWSGLGIISLATVGFALFAILIRPPVFLLTLLGTRLEPRARIMTAWFGPRGLSSLLLVMLAVFAAAPGADYLFAICSLVVLMSVVLHGGSMTFLSRRGGPPPAPVVVVTGLSNQEPVPHSSKLAQSPVDQAAALVGEAAPAEANRLLLGDLEARAAPARTSVADGLRITADEVRRLWSSDAPVLILDVRGDEPPEAPSALNALRELPDEATRAITAAAVPKYVWIVTYCT